ncbi:hypothetical protein [Robertmurraya sp. FSL R5-0851]|uniref:hypothetical protein n=1 Tax=Robertmurraya sp. FSL R5-0851 TaxID=2921584 RepID=UPI0030FACAB5
MPVRVEKMRVPDPFIMNEDEVNKAVAVYLVKHGFQNVKYLKGNETGIDVYGEKDGWSIYVESKGSHANNHGKDTVFDSNQIKTHTYMQICKLMELRNTLPAKTILVMANPNIVRIKERVEKVNTPLKQLEFIQFWVEEDGRVLINSPESCAGLLLQLDLI